MTDQPRERLLAAARRQFCRYGYQGTGVARVLADAGVSKKTLYERFRSKDDLLRAALEREGAEWRDWLRDGLAGIGGDGRARLLGVFDLLADWFASEAFYGCAFINAVAEHDKLASPLVGVVDRHRNLTDAILAPLVVDAGARDPDRVLRKLNLLIDGAIVTAMLERHPRAATEAKTVAALILDQRCEPAVPVGVSENVVG